jgi:hypothetical protein
LRDNAENTEFPDLFKTGTFSAERIFAQTPEKRKGKTCS